MSKSKKERKNKEKVKKTRQVWSDDVSDDWGGTGPGYHTQVYYDYPSSSESPEQEASKEIDSYTYENETQSDDLGFVHKRRVLRTDSKKASGARKNLSARRIRKSLEEAPSSSDSEQTHKKDQSVDIDPYTYEDETQSDDLGIVHRRHVLRSKSKKASDAAVGHQKGASSNSFRTFLDYFAKQSSSETTRVFEKIAKCYGAGVPKAKAVDTKNGFDRKKVNRIESHLKMIQNEMVKGDFQGMLTLCERFQKNGFNFYTAPLIQYIQDHLQEEGIDNGPLLARMVTLLEGAYSSDFQSSIKLEGGPSASMRSSNDNPYKTDLRDARQLQENGDYETIWELCTTIHENQSAFDVIYDAYAAISEDSPHYSVAQMICYMTLSDEELSYEDGGQDNKTALFKHAVHSGDKDLIDQSYNTLCGYSELKFRDVPATKENVDFMIQYANELIEASERHVQPRATK